MKLLEILEKTLRREQDFITDNGEIKKWVVINYAQNINERLIELLIENETLKEKFFKNIKKHWIFDYKLFVAFMENKNYFNDSYTKYKNKVRFNIGGKYLKQRNEVALVWPFKDCILEGGQSREEQKKNEIFFNEILAQDEINQLFEPKVLTNFKRYTAEGEQKVTEIKRDDNGTIKENMIIKGNNLLALYTLLPQFKGKIKLIYIDPPYNTGSDSFQYNDSFNHSSWLTFMKNRLEVAKELLRKDGVIFAQCDDNEQAYLKVLMDEIFGSENFVNTLTVRMKNIAGASGGGEDKRLKKNVEFINIFSKNYEILKPFENIYNFTEIFQLINKYKEMGISWKYTSILFDEGEKEYLLSTKDGEGKEIKIFRRKNTIFKSINEIAKEENITAKDVYYKYYNKIFTTAMPQSSIRIRVLESLRQFNKEFELISIQYVPRSGKNKGKVYEQFYKGSKLRLISWLKDVVCVIDNVIYKKDLQGTYWDGFNLNNLSKEGEIEFPSGKKPEALIERIVKMTTDINDIVLDYHLGSGTTAAVAHKMGKQYIGIEQLDYDENDSIVRLKNVIGRKVKKDGKLFENIEFDTGGISKAVNWQGGGDFIYIELKKYNQTFIEQIKDAKSINELLTIWEQMKEKSFLDYNLDIKKQDAEMESFGELSLNEQKQHLVEILDKNQMYVNLSSIDDKDFEVIEEDKKLTNDFYAIKK